MKQVYRGQVFMLDEYCEKYCEANPTPGVRLIAEGDSWFRYILGTTIVDKLAYQLEMPILNLADAGDTMTEMIDEVGRLKRSLRTMAEKGLAFDALVFSGGGNDIVHAMDYFLKNNVYLSTSEPNISEIVDQKILENKLDEIVKNYVKLNSAIEESSPDTHVFMHQYDYLQEGLLGEGASIAGPWVGHSFDKKYGKGGWDKKGGKAVIDYVVNQLAERLDQFASSHMRFTLVRSLGSLDWKHWEGGDEIHPNEEGFRKIARLFRNAIEECFPL